MRFARVKKQLAAAVAASSLLVGIVQTPAQAGTSFSTDDLGRPNEQMLHRIEEIAAAPTTPTPVATSLWTIAGFFRGTPGQGVALPKDAPAFTQFTWPTVGNQCIHGNLSATGTAIAVPGPASLPLPGVAAGHTAFVFTALGTGPATPGTHPMTVNWANLKTGKTGVTTMVNTGVNPNGPATLVGDAETGSGIVVAQLAGTVFNQDQAGTYACTFFPTYVTVRVP